MFKQCIVTAANYGPLLDVSSDKDAYHEVDLKLASILKEILHTDMSEEKLIELATTSKENGGMQMIFPAKFYDLMKIQVVELKKPNGKNIFSALRKAAMKLETESTP